MDDEQLVHKLVQLIHPDKPDEVGAGAIISFMYLIGFTLQLPPLTTRQL